MSVEYAAGNKHALIVCMLARRVNDFRHFSSLTAALDSSIQCFNRSFHESVGCNHRVFYISMTISTAVYPMYCNALHCHVCKTFVICSDRVIVSLPMEWCSLQQEVMLFVLVIHCEPEKGGCTLLGFL